MRRLNKSLATFIIISACGCAHHPTGSVSSVTLSPSPSNSSAPKPTTQPDPALLSIDKILPPVKLPQPTTRPAGQAPVEALELYAKARAAMADGQRFTAIGYLERAIEVDPYSADLYYSLGEASLGDSSSQDKSISAFEKSIDLRPDDLRAHFHLGRQLLAKGNVDRAITELRLAQVTSDYKKQPDWAAVTDYFLARALQQKGYDGAAIDQFQSLVEELADPTPEMKTNAELVFLINRPEVLHVQMAELRERHHLYAEALRDYEFAARRDPANFELQARVIRCMIAAGRREDAEKTAGEVLLRFKSNPASLKLMREVYQASGREDAVINQMMALHKKHPEDRSIVFALVDLLKSQNRTADAGKLLEQTAAENHKDLEVLRRLIDFYGQQNNTAAAGRALIEAVAVDPEMLREITPMWNDLIRAGRKNRLTVATVQRLQVSPQAEGAKQFFISRMADIWNRDALSRSALEKAVKSNPPVAPAYRALLLDILQRPDFDDRQKRDAIEKLIQQAQSVGDSPLALELRGLYLLNIDEKHPELAANLLQEAINAGGNSPELRLNYATVLRLSGNDVAAESTLWKIIADRPSFDDAYLALFNLYMQGRSPQQAWKVLQTWNANDPTNVTVRILQATVYVQRDRRDLAEQLLAKLLVDHSDDAQVLATAEAFFSREGRTNDYITALEQLRAKHPENRELVEQLVSLYAQANRVPDAIRVLDASRKAIAGDPDLMYYLAHLYSQIGQTQTGNQILAEILQIDPNNAPAANDLGYNLADSGNELDRAEKLIRIAVQEEPDNQAFLDSLGWVLYKRSKFPEAKSMIEKAIGPAARPDPIIVDHLGDIQYRLGQPQQALATWRRALQRTGEVAEREDIKTLRLSLTQKIKEASENKPADVAPVVEQPKGKVQQVLNQK